MKCPVAGNDAYGEYVVTEKCLLCMREKKAWNQNKWTHALKRLTGNTPKYHLWFILVLGFGEIFFFLTIFFLSNTSLKRSKGAKTLQSRLTLTPCTVTLQVPLSMRLSRQEYRSPALPGRFFTISATWEAHPPTTTKKKILLFKLICRCKAIPAEFPPASRQKLTSWS